MLERSSSFSRARTLLQRAGNGTSAQAGTGEAGVSPAGADPAAKAHDDPRATTAALGDLSGLLERLASCELAELVAVHEEPARSGSFEVWPDHMDPRLVAGLIAADRPAPYTHQAQALHAVASGRDVVIATATASGKSLGYQLPILNAVARDRDAKALLLFPTKALARDQVESLRALARALEVDVGVGIYDGDTPPDARRAARSRAHVVATNPDMLHRGLLPHHDQWGRFIAGLRYLVIDELHTYRGLFGSHVANVLRRLWRCCAHYGSRPQVIACSATIANPAELAEALCGRGPCVCVDRDASPRGPRTMVVLNPAVVDPITGVRRDYLKLTHHVATTLRAAGVQTLAFCRTRKAVELLTRYLRDDEAKTHPAGAEGAAAAVRGYRGGYLPDRRREVEDALRSGQARIVATTHALELGIDIGHVDAVVLSGYPGSRAATWQRAGRAGRRGQRSLAVLCLSSAPLDQFVAGDPGFLWGKPPEHARIDPDNPEVLLPHLRCAAAELPLASHESLAGLPAADYEAALEVLCASGLVHVDVDPDGARHLVPTHADSPAHQVDLRGSVEENFAVVDDATADILAEVDFEDAPLYLHPGAIYAVEGRTYEVVRLEWDARKAFVRAVASDYYTEASSKLRVRVIEPQAGEPCERGRGYAHVIRTVPGFKKIRLQSHENIGYGLIELPDLELHTQAAYWAVPQAFLSAVVDPVRRASATLAAGHAVHHVAALLLMSDVADLGHAVTASHPGSLGEVVNLNRGASVEARLAAFAEPYLVLYDRVAGGAGLASTAFEFGADLFERAGRIVSACRCARGCPTCMGPSSDDAWESDRGDVGALLAAWANAGK